MEKAVVRLNVSFRVARPVVIPPFSAKVSRLILHRISRLYAALSSASQQFKPVSVSPVYLDDRPLLKFKDDNHLLFLKDGRCYGFTCSMVIEDDFPFYEVVSLENQTIDDVFGSSVILEEIKMEVRKLSSLGLGKPRGVRLSFLTPLLLQLPSYGRLRRDGGRYLLFPLPSLLIGSLIDHWNANCGHDLLIKRPAYLSAYANYLLMEADYDLRPVTVVYDEKRRPRGFMGWVLYDLRRSRRTNSFKRIMTLLDYAQYVGIGKSRATGFGQVAVKAIY